MTPATPKGDVIRTAALDLLDRFPDLPGAVYGRLNLLARLADASHLPPAEVRDTRGRWVRRQQGNGGPGVPGLAHVAVSSHQTPLNDAEAVCGTRLRGGLEWGDPVARSPRPDGWRPCRKCRRVLAATTSAAPGVAA